MECTHRHHGFTLLELMMVVVLLGLVASLGVTGLSASSDASKLRETLALIEDLDGRLRIDARREGALTLSTGSDGAVLTTGGPEGGTQRQRIDTPSGCRVELLNPGSLTPLESIEYLRLGMSIDYLVRISTGSDNRVWRVAGLTGYVEALDSETGP